MPFVCPLCPLGLDVRRNKGGLRAIASCTWIHHYPDTVSFWTSWRSFKKLYQPMQIVSATFVILNSFLTTFFSILMKRLLDRRILDRSRKVLQLQYTSSYLSSIHRAVRKFLYYLRSLATFSAHSSRLIESGVIRHSFSN